MAGRIAVRPFLTLRMGPCRGDTVDGYHLSNGTKTQTFFKICDQNMFLPSANHPEGRAALRAAARQHLASDLLVDNLS